tara:strand:- start:2429 stop:2578 length:150 start_codon:yes stop_codon:yes gene_type:complete
MSLVKNIARTMTTLQDADGSISVVGFYVFIAAIIAVLGAGVAIPHLLIN